jgi:hypothetical protein
VIKMNITMIRVYIILAMFAVCISADAGQSVVEVPQIGNMSEAEAFQMSEKIGLVPEFRPCFSDETKKYFIVPGSQDPEAGMLFLTGKEVRAVVSRGPLPNVIGLSENEAKYMLEEAGLSYEVQYGRNISVKDGYVFDQEPKNATCTSPDFSVKIYVNKSLSVEIESPQENENVSSIVVVTGRMSSDLLENESLWIAVKPLRNVKDWWPQNNLPKLVPVNREFEGNAFLGGNMGDRFEIGILVVDKEINKTFMDYMTTSLNENNWPSITQGRTGTNQKVPKEVIEAHKLAKVNVILNQ